MTDQAPMSFSRRQESEEGIRWTTDGPQPSLCVAYHSSVREWLACLRASEIAFLQLLQDGFYDAFGLKPSESEKKAWRFPEHLDTDCIRQKLRAASRRIGMDPIIILQSGVG